jgi:hypothetical protein
MADVAAEQYHPMMTNNIKILNMKKIIINFCVFFAFPALLSAQYSGGDGRGDAALESINIPVGVKESNREALSLCMLQQNFPNPFTNVTNIEFTVEQEEKIRLEVYNITGCLVRSVLDEIMKPGTYTSSFDGSYLNSGLYCCRLSCGKHSCTKRMLLIK